MSRTLHLAEQLIAQASVTPADAACQEIIGRRLAALGFACESMVFGPAHWRVSNLWAKRPGAPDADHAGKLLVFAGHTDVVPPVRWSNGTVTRSHPPTATAICTGAARAT